MTQLYIFLVEGFLRSTLYACLIFESWSLLYETSVKCLFARLLLQVSQSTVDSTVERGGRHNAQLVALILLDASHKAAEASGLSRL